MSFNSSFGVGFFNPVITYLTKRNNFKSIPYNYKIALLVISVFAVLYFLYFTLCKKNKPNDSESGVPDGVRKVNESQLSNERISVKEDDGTITVDGDVDLTGNEVDSDDE